MDLGAYAGRNALSDEEMSALLAIPAVNHSVSRSTLHYLDILARRIGNPFEEMGEGHAIFAAKEYARLFPYMKTLDGSSFVGVAKERVEPLALFWREVPLFTGLGPGEGKRNLPGVLERYKLERDNGAPALFLGMIMNEATRAHRDELVAKYFYPVKREFDQMTFNPDFAANW